jgi:hypothetical protein
MAADTAPGTRRIFLHILSGVSYRDGEPLERRHLDDHADFLLRKLLPDVDNAVCGDTFQRTQNS